MYCAIFVIATPWLNWNFYVTTVAIFLVGLVCYGSWHVLLWKTFVLGPTWRKGLKRVWELPTRTHSGLVAPLCGLLPLRFELACRCSRFIVKCLTVLTALLGLLLDKVCSIKECIHTLAEHSATLLGTPLSKLASINKKMAWTTVNNRVLFDSNFSNMNVIRELLYIKHNFADMTLYSKDEIDFILEYCCTS